MRHVWGENERIAIARAFVCQIIECRYCHGREGRGSWRRAWYFLSRLGPVSDLRRRMGREFWPVECRAAIFWRVISLLYHAALCCICIPRTSLHSPSTSQTCWSAEGSTVPPPSASLVEVLCNGIGLGLERGAEVLANYIASEEVGDGRGMVLQCVVRVEPVGWSMVVVNEGYGVRYHA